MTDQPQGEMPEGDKPSGEKPVSDKPALTVVIQSWWTPALAVIALAVGLVAGYFGRPLINPTTPADSGAAALVTPPSGETANPTATIDPQQVQQIMTSIVAQTTNFLGDPKATVTLIEFSDYQ